MIEIIFAVKYEKSAEENTKNFTKNGISGLDIYAIMNMMVRKFVGFAERILCGLR